MSGKSLDKLADGAGLLLVLAVIAVKHLHECPLCPLVERRIAGLDFAVPVIAETYLVELLTIAGDVLHGGLLGMLTRLYRILLGRQTIGIITHWMKHIEASQTLVARKDVGCYIAERMAYVKSGSRRVGEHVKHIVLGLVGIDFSLIYIVIAPILLPA